MDEKVILGGTFDHVHIGHQRFLETALEIGETTVCLVSDEMLKRWKPDVIRSYEERKRKLEAFLSRFDKDWRIIPINDPYKEAVEGEYDVLVVSYDTKKRGKEINKMRKKRDKEPLEMTTVKPVLADDLLPVNSSRIREGEINEVGERLRPVKVKVGSKNDVKIEVVEEVLSDYFDVEIESKGMKNVPEQPFNDEIIRSAKKRAEISKGYDYGVGIESGIITTEDRTFSVEYAYVKDKYGFDSTGHGPGFPIPKNWKNELNNNNINLGNKIKIYFENYSDESGSIGLLTDNKIKRRDCIKNALLTAMIPRLNSNIYFEENGF
ncbi:MAG: pantetheine-phosphate adenylyltransferase [Thermoplasmatota archaeon]